MNLENESVESLLQKEWLETNGIGGYASSSICGANTRKYHGLLVAALNPPVDRRVLVSKIEERVLINGQYHDLSVNQYPGAIHPQGHWYLRYFERKPVSTWTYEGANWKIQKKVFMVPKSNTTVVVYENIGDEAFEIELHPLLTHKDFHHTLRENSFDFDYERSEKNIKVNAYTNSEPLYINWSKGDFIEDRAWYKNIELSKEQFRGEGFLEDYYRIGYLETHLEKGEKISMVLSTDENMMDKSATDLEANVLQILESLQNKNIQSIFYNDLLVSGNQFLVDRASTKSKSILAGYHWFSDWGRDTMIAMRGLTIATGYKETSKSILSTFLKYLDKGMLPNRFPDRHGDDIQYNTIDATLWLFIAMYDYEKKFDDKAFIQKNMKALEDILLHHINGTRYNIHVTEEGFVSGGEDGWQLTWMDAIVDGHVVTPRIGCPVEINALWYNAMCIYEYFCGNCNEDLHRNILEIKNKFNHNFRKYFLNDLGYLNDVVIPNVFTDASFRPNQIYAVSLPFALLNKDEEKRIVELVGEKLLTGFGLRTLCMEDAEFGGSYGGNKWERDHVYHQGTIWPFLIMEYWEAYLKTHNASEASKRKVLQALEPFREHFYNSECIHGISEIFDGEHPTEGRGCVQQAWSVAALIKLYSDYKLYELEE